MSRYAQAAAIVPEPCRVFGTMLRPFCLGHHLLMKRLGLPFAGSALADAGEEDIMLGVAICGGASYEETLEQFHSGEWPNVFQNWKDELRGNWWNRRKLPKTFIADGETLFRAYLQDGYQKTPVWNHDVKDGVTISAPWELFLKNRLVMAGYSQTEVLNGYLPACWYDYYSICELKWASECRDPKTWRKIFFTQEDFEAMNPEESK